MGKVSALTLLFANVSILSVSFCEAVEKETKSPKTKAAKGKKGKKDSAIDSPTFSCTREVYSVVAKNPSWPDHNFHHQVWYHTLNDIHTLWQEDYFDYVLDIRPLEDLTIDNAGTPLLLEGWQTLHIPGSYPITVFPPTTPAEDVDMLVDFTSSNTCKDARVFVHCWSGISGNMVAKTLIELGFTNVHAAGPEGSAGMWDWAAAGYDVVYNDTFVAEETRFHPACIKQCSP